MHVCQQIWIYSLVNDLQVQENSPGEAAGLEAFFDFIVAIENIRLVSNQLYSITSL